MQNDYTSSLDAESHRAKLCTQHMGKISAISLLCAALMSLTMSANATIVLLSAWQEGRAIADAENGTVFRASQVSSGSGGIPGTRSFSASASVPFVSPDTTASAMASQTSAVGGLGFQFSGSVSTQQVGTFPSSLAEVQHFFDIRVADHNETVTLNLTNLSMVGYDPSMSPGFHYQVTGGPFTSLTSPQSVQFSLLPGDYRITAGTAIFDNAYDSADRSTVFNDTIGFSDLAIADGAFQNHPLISSNFSFFQAPSRAWFDPPTASEFAFQMTDSSLFTDIMSFPTGFSAEFEVLVNNISLGFFNTDQSVNFTELLGHGVSSFDIRNIIPGVDPTNPTAFPIQLAFNNDTASFTMTPVTGDVPLTVEG